MEDDYGALSVILSQLRTPERRGAALALEGLGLSRSNHREEVRLAVLDCLRENAPDGEAAILLRILDHTGVVTEEAWKLVEQRCRHGDELVRVEAAKLLWLGGNPGRMEIALRALLEARVSHGLVVRRAADEAIETLASKWP